MASFSTIVYRSGHTYQIDIPDDISIEMGLRKYIPVKGQVNKHEFKATLIPRKNNRHVLFLNSEIRRKAKIKDGDSVVITFEYDQESRDISIPEDVELILSESAQVYQTFLQLSPSYRREILKYILMAKREETRLKRIELVAQRMRERFAKRK